MLYNIALVALAGFASATTFSGTGQLRALASGNGSDLGCITDSGAWTVNDTLCGNFTGTRSSTVYTTITSLDGPCTLEDSNFVCGTDITALQFWVCNRFISLNFVYRVLTYNYRLGPASSMTMMSWHIVSKLLTPAARTSPRLKTTPSQSALIEPPMASRGCGWVGLHCNEMRKHKLTKSS